MKSELRQHIMDRIWEAARMNGGIKGNGEPFTQEDAERVYENVCAKMASGEAQARRAQAMKEMFGERNR